MKSTREVFYIGERVSVTVSISNGGREKVNVMKIPKALWTFDILFEIKGEKTGRVLPQLKMPAPTAPVPDDYRELAPNESLNLDIDLEQDCGGLSPQKVDAYSISVSVLVDGRRIVSPEATFHVSELPPLRSGQSVEFTLRAQGGKYKRLVEVGVLPADAGKGLLVAVFRETGISQDKYEGVPRVIRLGPAETSLVIDSKAHVLSDRGDDTRTAVHVLVSHSNQAQQYFILSLTSKQVTYTEMFKDGKNRMLSTDTSGIVEIKVKK